MKILVFGAGVLGSYYASKLHEAKLDVTILARGEKFKNIQEQGIILENYFTGETSIRPVRVIDRMDADEFDLVLVFVQNIHIREILPILVKMKKPESFIFFGNNFKGFEHVCQVLGKERVLAGFGSIGGKRKKHSVIYVEANRKNPKKSSPIIIGELNGKLTDRIQKINGIFQGAGIGVTLSKEMVGWLKTHAAVILCIAGAAYKANLELKKLAENKALLMLMIRSMKESVKILFYAGITVEPFKYRVLALLPDFILYNLFRKMLVTEFAAIGLAGHARAARAEMKALAEDFLDLVKKSEIQTDVLKKILSYI